MISRILVMIAIAAVALPLSIAALSMIATMGAVVLVVGAAVLWMSSVYLLAQRLAPRRRDENSGTAVRA